VVVAFFTRRLASLQGKSQHDPHYLSRILEVIERHQWTRLVSLSLLHAQREGGSVSSPAMCVADPAFRSEACHGAGTADVPAPATVDAACAPPVRVSDPEQAVYQHRKTTKPPILRSVLDRLLRRPLPRRFFASVRWRSGLDADLQDLRERLDRVAAALDASRVQAGTAEARLDAEVRRIAHEVATLESARRELVARGDAFESRLVAVQESLAAVASGENALTRHADAGHPGAETGQRVDQLGGPVRAASRPRNAAR
jgi:hypothetical protein